MRWQASIGPEANEQNPVLLVEGIDHLAVVCRHEARHVAIWSAWWLPGWGVGAVDTDFDYIPDDIEVRLPYGYHVGDLSTYGDPYETDSEHYVEQTRQQWATGSADGEDWANPGHQSSR